MLIEAMVAPDTPLLPPRSPQQKVDTMLTTRVQEDAAAALRRQRGQEAEADGEQALSRRSGGTAAHRRIRPAVRWPDRGA